MDVMRSLVVLGVLTASFAMAAKIPPPNRLTLVTASCFNVPPAPPAPCSPAFRFASGSATLKSAKEPVPTCPKSNGLDPTEAPAGDVRLTGVTKGGAAFSGTLEAWVAYQTTFGDDPNGNCELRGQQVPSLVSLIAKLACTSGKC